MKISNYKLVLITLLTVVSTTFVAAQNIRKFFEEKDIMKMGVYYYPEHWPEEQWDRDLKSMADMGFEFTHFGEFAWAFMEPEEGKFDFSWLDKAVSLADKHGLKVIMCTPTPTPPAWMSTNYPEILMTNKSDRIIRHGTRQHASWSSEKYLGFVKRIVEQLALRYGDDERIIGWQLDNEPSHYGLTDYSDAAQSSFVKWLKEKYRTLDKLNHAWGTRFWSEYYTKWDQIRIPNELELVQFINPHAILDFKRFNSGEVNEFLQYQYDILREKIGNDQWITTNFIRFTEPVDPKASKGLDFASWTNYPVAGYNQGIGEEGFRRGMPNDISFGSDFFRPIHEFTGIMELQISQVCWGNYSPRLQPGMRKTFLYQVLAGGNDFSCSYRFRQPTFNYEQNIIGIVGTDGVTPSDGGKEYIEFMDELQILRDNRPESPTIPEVYKNRKAAILWNADNLWLTNYQKHTDQWDYMSHQFGYYDALKQLGCPVDYITEDQDMSGYAVVVVPAYELVDETIVNKWKSYVEAGGNLVITCRTGAKDRSGLYWEAARSEPITELIGSEISYFDNLPNDIEGQISFNDSIFSWNNWGEVLQPDKSTEVWAKHDNQFYKGSAAITHKKYKNGNVTYVSVDTDEKLLEKAVLKNVFVSQNIDTADYPLGVNVEWHDGFWIAVNYTDKAYQLPLTASDKIIIGDKSVQPGGASVWIEEK
jgi:beta-galactosidase